MQIDGLTQAQAVALLRKHATGDIGGHDWRTIQVLMRDGYLGLDKDGKSLLVTPKGKAWCDRHHMEVNFAR